MGWHATIPGAQDPEKPANKELSLAVASKTTGATFGKSVLLRRPRTVGTQTARSMSHWLDECPKKHQAFLFVRTFGDIRCRL
jgi:hypothetical protein